MDEISQTQKSYNKFGFVLAAIGLIIAYFLSMSAVVALVAYFNHVPFKKIDLSIQFTGVTINAVLWIIFTIIPMKKLNEIDSTSMKNPIKTYFIGVFVMYSSVIILGLILIILGFEPTTQDVANDIEKFGKNNIALTLLCSSLFIPIIEEILFRGILHRSLKFFLSVTLSTLISATIFGLVHNHLDALPQLIILAVVFTWSYENSKTILIPIALHATNNLFSTIILIYKSDLAAYAEKYKAFISTIPKLFSFFH